MSDEVFPGGDPKDVVDGPYDPEKHGALHPQSKDHPHPDKDAKVAKEGKPEIKDEKAPLGRQQHNR